MSQKTIRTPDRNLQKKRSPRRSTRKPAPAKPTRESVALFLSQLTDWVEMAQDQFSQEGPLAGLLTPEELHAVNFALDAFWHRLEVGRPRMTGPFPLPTDPAPAQKGGA